MITIFKILSLALLGLFVFAGLKSMYQFMWASLFSFGILMFFAHIDQIKKIKFGKSGFEAETKELNELIGRAKVTINELQQIAIVVGSLTLSLVQRSGRMGGYDETEKENIKDEIISLLSNLDLKQNEIDKLFKEWYSWVELDYVFCILGNNIVPEGFDETQISEWKALRRRGRNNLPSPDELKEFLKRNGKLTELREELIVDYEYYIKTKQHRRLDTWEEHLRVGRL